MNTELNISVRKNFFLGAWSILLLWLLSPLPVYFLAVELNHTAQFSKVPDPFEDVRVQYGSPAQAKSFNKYQGLKC